MDDKLFSELCESIKQVGAIERGDIEASRVHTVEPIDVKAIRQKVGRTQESFSQMIGVSLSTLRSWEQQRRQPRGPARALLTIFKNNPMVANELLHS